MDCEFSLRGALSLLSCYPRRVDALLWEWEWGEGRLRARAIDSLPRAQQSDALFSSIQPLDANPTAMHRESRPVPGPGTLGWIAMSPLRGLPAVFTWFGNSIHIDQEQRSTPAQRHRCTGLGWMQAIGLPSGCGPGLAGSWETRGIAMLAPLGHPQHGSSRGHSRKVL